MVDAVIQTPTAARPTTLDAPSTTGEVVARLRGVRRSYRIGSGLDAGADVVALDGVDLDLPAGIVGVLGPNGSGKSTMFRLLLGLEQPDAGEVDVLGWPAATAAMQIRAEVGFMPEDDSLFPELRAMDAVVYAARLSGLSAVDATTAAHRTLDRVELGGDRYRAAAALSLGGRQRLRLAMALVHAPRLLLLDEPTAGLDPEARADLLRLIAEVGAGGMAVLLSTHVLGDVDAICDKVVVLSKGKVVYAGEASRFRGSGRAGAATILELDRDAAEVLPALRAAGVEASAEGSVLRIPGTGAVPEPVWRVLAAGAVGIRRVGPAREDMADAFVRHLRLDDPQRRLAEASR